MNQRIGIPLALLAAGLLAGGCSTVENNHRQKIPLMTAWVCGNSTEARGILDNKLKEPAWYNSSRIGTGDELVWRLEAGTVDFVTGDFDGALDEFRACENLIHDYDERATVSVRDVSSEVGSSLTNPNALPYRGWCRDRMGLHIYKSLAYLGQGREDSFRAQLKELRTRQADIKADYEKYFEDPENGDLQKTKDDKNKKYNAETADKIETQLAADPGYQQNLAEMREVANKGYGDFLNPLALYLSALGNLRDGNWENAKINTDQLWQALPKNPFTRMLHATAMRNAGREVPAALAQTPSFPFPIDRDCLYVIFANGQGAALEQEMVASELIHFAWPKCKFHPAAFRNARISAGGKKATTIPLADMDAILAEEYKKRLPGIITRTVISTLVKEGAYRGGQVAAIAANNDRRVQAAAFVAVTVAGSIYRYAMNTADTRSWETLPKEFQVAVLPMPADRKAQVTLNGVFGGVPREVAIPAGCPSAVLFINAPSPANVRCQVLPFASK